GKTTTTYLLESILKAAGYTPGVLGTVSVRYGDRGIPASLTTPEGPDLQRHLADMAAAGVNHAVMEVASHALELGRVAGCHFDLGLFTNLTQDHLDFHGGFESYYEAKKKLFTRHLTGRRLAGGPKALVNVDDKWGRRLVRDLSAGALTMSLEGPADFAVWDYSVDRRGLRAGLDTPAGRFEVRAALLGDVNVYNVLAASGAALLLGLDPGDVIKGIASAPQTPGRLERVGSDDRYLVLVDYSHTPDSLARALKVARHLQPRRLLTVFGCGGDRDRTKRPLMGRAAATLADVAIVSSDNPRTEDPLAIIEDILGGMKDLGLVRLEPEGLEGDVPSGSYTVVPDRRSAIRLACRLLGEGDMLVVAGKGHEDYQILGREKVHFDDREEALAALETEGKS
ncbi:MAG: UDP-N-acetylmuramoyl-L-alanyl-D-glutamate--2,6-diaminopimelate ligase, partial [Thermodesulfobacteriota bacterium]